jgi:threonine aldolase
MKAVSDVARKNNIPIHLDGARIFNAAVYLNLPVAQLVQDVDDLCFCISKGLSAPVGSLLCSTKDFIVRARKWRKMLGGGMRQAGVLAAAGIVALNTMVDRLAEDHENARRLAIGLAQIPGIKLNPENIQTNIVVFHLDERLGDPQAFMKRLAEHGVKVTSQGGRRIRMVTHRHITRENVDEAVSCVNTLVNELFGSRVRA